MTETLQRAIELRTGRHYTLEELNMIMDIAGIVAEKGDGTSLKDLSYVVWEGQPEKIVFGSLTRRYVEREEMERRFPMFEDGYFKEFSLYEQAPPTTTSDRTTLIDETTDPPKGMIVNSHAADGSTFEWK
jgi:hypothetical protein